MTDEELFNVFYKVSERYNHHILLDKIVDLLAMEYKYDTLYYYDEDGVEHTIDLSGNSVEDKKLFREYFEHHVI